NKTNLIFSVLCSDCLIFSIPSDKCHLTPNEGHGSSFNFAVYYDSTKDQCSPFIYKGEGGNANRFENEAECMRNCSPNAENIYPMDGKRTKE
uniref:BPTI/Kunitz inhibitor domain-containing protein n=1 Tax=Neolamprologus brichardi TaxID=32507 RepID=A0A3Q4HPN0_NEOBR